MNVLQYFDRHRLRLCKLPYHEEGVLDQIAALIGERKDLDALFEEDLHGGAPIWRQAALDFFASGRTDARDEVDHLDEGTHVFHGDLVIHNNVNVQGCLVVLGDLQVDGNLLAFRDYPVICVGGTLRCKNLYANETEIVCGGDLAATEAVLLVYNHTVVVVNTLRTPALIAEDAYPDATLAVGQHHEGGSYDVYRERFGIELDEDADDFDPDEHVFEPVISKLLEPPAS